MIHYSIYDLYRKGVKVFLLSLPFLYRKKNIHIGKNFFSDGLFDLRVEDDGELYIGDKVSLINSTYYNGFGVVKKNSIYVKNKAKLSIGDFTGLTGVSIYCAKSIIIGNYVLVGANCFIFDTDFHPIDPVQRRDQIKSNVAFGESKPVVLKENCFIGANTIISKGVTIGENSVIAAGSRIIKDVPANEVWGGNPSKFIKKIQSE